MKGHLNKSKTSPRAASRAKKWWKLVLTLAAVFAVAAAVAVWLMPSRLVSLNVKDADLGDVVRSLSRQSGRPILIAPNTGGKVTIRFRKKTLAEALDIVAGQTSSLWRGYFAISDSPDSIAALKRSLQEGGEVTGWAMTRRSGWGGLGIGGADGFLMDAPQRFSYTASDKSAKDVALALSYRARERVVVSDSLADRVVNVDFKNVTIDRAVSALAGKLHGRVENFYIIQSFSPVRMRAEAGIGGEGSVARTSNQGAFGPGRLRPPDARPVGSSTTTITGGATTAVASASAAGSSPGTEPAAAGALRRRELTAEERERIRAEQEQAWKEHLEAMPPEQRQRAEQLRAQFEQFRQQAATMTLSQQIDAARRFIESNPQIQERGRQQVMERLKTTTPEQRVEFYRQFNQAMKWLKQMQQDRSAISGAIPATAPKPPAQEQPQKDNP